MSFRIPVRPAEADTIVRGSRFRAWIGRAVDAEEAAAALHRRVAAGKDATHHCWAYRIWRDERVEEAGFDAGEPSGTAGRPILGSLQAAALIQTVCVVSRWFGGVKLGTGGLVRAYAESTRSAIEGARETGAVLDARQEVTIDVRFPYALLGAVRGVVSRFAAASAGSDYSEVVDLELRVPADRADAFERALADGTAGGIDLRRGTPRWEAVPPNAAR
ncbi:MAG TPA: YigZ family protein [Gemmatimonadota bacterium]|nr:YigZ family protein [Gemmatimonadota bacterium]